MPLRSLMNFSEFSTLAKSTFCWKIPLLQIVAEVNKAVPIMSNKIKINTSFCPFMIIIYTDRFIIKDR
jgi:hypothetical protein